MQRGEPSRLAAILVHVTVIRATTGTPRPFNDFYPLANVLYVRTCEISLVCICARMCEYISPAYSGVQSSSVVRAKSPLVQPLLNSPSTIILEREFGVKTLFNFLLFVEGSVTLRHLQHDELYTREVYNDPARLASSQFDRFSTLRCKYHIE